MFLFSIASGCSEKPEHARAKALMQKFTCATHNGTWGAFMENNREKAEKFLENYEKGMHLLGVSIEVAIQGELDLYLKACESSNKNMPFP